MGSNTFTPVRNDVKSKTATTTTSSKSKNAVVESWEQWGDDESSKSADEENDE